MTKFTALAVIFISILAFQPASAVLLTYDLSDPDSGLAATFVFNDTSLDGSIFSNDLQSISTDLGDGLFTYNFNETSAVFCGAYDTADLSLISWTCGGTFISSTNASASGLLQYSHTWFDESTFILGGQTTIADWNGNGIELSASTDLNVANNVPEPSIIALLGLGLAGLGFSRRRKAQA